MRSTKNIDANQRATDYDEDTGLTTYTARPNTDLAVVRKRYFHTLESITEYIEAVGFTVIHSEQYDERLFHDYDRTVPVEHSDNLLEVIAAK